MEDISGIYRIVCVDTGDYYYGSSKNIQYRWKAHKNRLRKKTHINNRIQRIWNKYGEQAFRVEVVEVIPVDALFEVEDRYLKEHVGKPHCMNISTDAYAPRRNRKHIPCSEETKQKIRTTLMGHSVSEETRKKIGIACKGKNLGPCSESRRVNIAKAKHPANGFPLVKSPDGQVHRIGILTDFCNEHGLYLPAMSYLLNQKAKSVKGWVLV